MSEIPRDALIAFEPVRPRQKQGCNNQLYAAIATGVLLVCIIIIWHEFPQPQTSPRKPVIEYSAEDRETDSGEDAEGEPEVYVILDPKSIAFRGADERLLRPEVRSKQKIPKILHQAWWTGTPYVSRFQQYRRSWIDMHLEWEHQLWTDRQNRELVQQHYAWFLPTYDNFPIDSMRSESSIYLYMHRYGGVFASLDSEPLKPVDFFTDNVTSPVALAYGTKNFRDANNVQTGFLVSEPGHPFWLMVMIQIAAAAKKYPQNTSPDFITGPILLNRAIRAYTSMQRGIHQLPSGAVEVGSRLIYDLKMIRPGLIFPFQPAQEFSPLGRLCSGSSAKQDETACKAKYFDAYVIRYWMNSWREEWDSYLNKTLRKREYLPSTSDPDFVFPTEFSTRAEYTYLPEK